MTSSLLDIVVSGSLDGMLAVHCLSDGRRIRTWSYPNNFKPALIVLSKDGDVFVVSNEEHTLHSFSVNGELLQSTRLFTREVTSLIPTADGQYILLGGEDRVISMRSTLNLTGNKRIQLEENYGSIRSMELSDYLFCGIVAQKTLVGLLAGSIWSKSC